MTADAADDVPADDPSVSDDSADKKPPEKMREVRYEFTPNFPELLQQAGVTLLVSTYQAGKVLMLGSHAGQLTISFCHFDQAMGIATERTRLAFGTRRQIHFLKSAPDLGPQMEPPGTHDGCWLPRATFYTGNIHGHDLAWGAEGLWVVNTLFSTLCTLHEEYSFVPRWRPKFITELQGQDRCHLNGLALENGKPRYVTVMAESNEPGGWRPTKATTGCVIDVPSQETIVRGLAMPHSPRLSNGRLWVLNSGCGEIGTVDLARGKYEAIESVPGYTRGMAFAGRFAFVGLSRIRETSVFGGVPIAENRENLKCGVALIDLSIGRTVASFQFHSGVEEIFAVEVLPQRNAHIQGPATERDDEARDAWLVPPPGSAIRPEPTGAVYARPGESFTNIPVRSQAPAPGPSRWDQLLAQAKASQGAGRHAEAVSLYEQAIQLAPQPANLLVDLGNLQQEMNNQDAALETYRKAIGHDRKCVAAWQNYVYLLFNRGEVELAVQGYETLLQLDPSPLNHLLSAIALPVIYESTESAHTWRKRLDDALAEMVKKRSTVDATRQQVPTTFFVTYAGLDDRPVLENFGKVLRGADTSRRKNPGRSGSRGRIKLGMFSAYFHDHTIGRLNIGRAEQLDRDQFELHILYPGRATDAMQQRFQRTAEHFHHIPRQVAPAREQISALDLDLLFFTDVGMDALSSTLAYSRMAPVQCTTWGHPQTSGSPYMDYFISSQLLETDDADRYYTERLVRLPHLGTYYERPFRTGPERTRDHFGLPDDRRLYVCPQTLFKFHPDFDEVLRGILEGDPEGDLVVLSGRVPIWVDRLRQRWKRTIPDFERRVRFLPATPRDDFLALLTLSDVMLDTFPFGGGNSSYEGLALGVPIVTLPTPYLRGRITHALYRKMGDTSLCADSPEEYVQIALRVAKDAAGQRALRERLEQSARALFEDPREVRELEAFFQEAAAGKR